MQSSNAGRKAGEEFKKLFEKKREGIAAAEKDLKKFKDELDKQGPIMTEDARRERELLIKENYAIINCWLRIQIKN